MKLRTALLSATTLLLAPSAAEASCSDPGNCFIVRAQSAAQVAAILQAHGLTFVEQADPSKPEIFLAEGPGGTPVATTLANLGGDSSVLDSEQASVASLAEDDSSAVLDSVALASLDALGSNGTSSGIASTFFTSGAWSGYLDQPAAAHVRLAATHALAPIEAKGVGVVAIIDTGIDPDHPLLDGALVTGFDAIDDQIEIPSEWDNLDPATAGTTEANLRAAADQSYAGIVEGVGTTVAKGAGVEIVVDQSYAGIVESENLPAGFGHGTMVAGVVRMVAPNARIMPIRAFDGDGTGELWDIVKGIYFATLAGADVINMSFSLDQHSEALENAINFAKFLGVTCISSTGNQGTMNSTYPAALGNVIGVASTDIDDNLSPFSNYGMGLATLAAPGEAIVTLFPGNLYTGAWGTSFSAAFVSGTVAVLHDERTIFGFPVVIPIGFSLAEVALTNSAYNPDPPNLTDWGAGRLDVRDAFDLGLVGTN